MEAIRFQTLMLHEMTGEAAALEGFAEQAMGEYDLDGWTVPDLFNPADVSVLHTAGGA